LTVAGDLRGAFPPVSAGTADPVLGVVKTSPTISDVAVAAGVSIATVSRALRNMPGVSENTRTRVIEAARQLHYVMAPLPIGRSFGAQARIAVVAPRLDTWFFGHVVAALTTRLSDFGLVCELHIVPTDSDRNRFFACAPLRGRVQGVVVIGMSLTGYEISSLSSLGVPVVGVHSNLPPPNVELDDAAMARCAVDHLIGLGHTRIAMIASVGGTAPIHVVPKLRSGGYHRAMREAGITVDPELVLCGEDTVAGGAKAMSTFVARRRLPTAVFAHTDDMAFGAFSVLRGAGLRVPADVSVVAIDNSQLASAFQLTTVAQHVEEQGREAADLVVRALGRSSPRPPARVVTTSPHLPHLVVRASTAPPPSTATASRPHRPPAVRTGHEPAGTGREPPPPTGQPTVQRSWRAFPAS
jgi:LacI family repressor for deo operon, udp, cdd, tsx, nupC, and nupG